MTNLPATADTIAADALRLGVKPGGVLLVHSSLRSLGALLDGTETVIRGLLQALGAHGTLLMPALSYLSVGRRSPRFDVLRTPSCVGALPEAFRTRPGTLRSIHPTHSVSGVGKRAAELLADHQLDTTPVGSHSPFTRLPLAGGQLLFIGCGMRPNTSMHGIEEQVVPPYLFSTPVEYEITLADQTTFPMTVIGHNLRGVGQRYERVAPLLPPDALHRGKIAQADCQLVDAVALWQTALAVYRRDPLYFIEPEPEDDADSNSEDA